MLPFSCVLRTGAPAFEQLVLAVRRASVVGQLRPGDPFPPNAAYDVVAALVAEGFLEQCPGTSIAVTKASDAVRARLPALLQQDLERLLVEARRLGLHGQDVVNAVAYRWERNPHAGQA